MTNKLITNQFVSGGDKKIYLTTSKGDGVGEINLSVSRSLSKGKT